MTRPFIPLIGLGTYPLKGDECVNAVRSAIETGIRHVDSAQMYGNEKAVGLGVAGCGVPREKLFIVTKVEPQNLTLQRFAASVERSVDDLGGPPDLLLIHWPPADDTFDAMIDALVAAREKGMARSIGVSNFTIAMMQRAQARAGGAIICNQVEFHPLFDQSRLLAAATALAITVTAYSPLVRGKAMMHETIQAIAARLQRPPSEVVLRWIVQQGVAAIPMTRRRENCRSNLNALQFELAAEDMAAISAIGTRSGRSINPAWMAGRWDD